MCNKDMLMPLMVILAPSEVKVSEVQDFQLEPQA